jgi:multidrug efflux pump subunit AcrA (membrane-fusion protein)
MKKNASLAAISHTLLITLLLLLLSSCDKAQNSPAVPAQPPAPPPANVKIAQPLSQQVTEWDEFTGRIEAVNTVEVRARVSGYSSGVVTSPNCNCWLEGYYQNEPW